MTKMPPDIRKTQYERLKTRIFEDSNKASVAIAREIAELIRAKASEGKNCVLGLATGSSPKSLYNELVRLHQEEGLSFRNVITFNLDEYYPMDPDALQSYVRFMHEYLFNHVDIDPEHVNIPDGTLARDDVYSFCVGYEEKIKEAGGLDLQILGIGRTGHIGFNEPGSGINSRTRLISLDYITMVDAASDFLARKTSPAKPLRWVLERL